MRAIIEFNCADCGIRVARRIKHQHPRVCLNCAAVRMIRENSARHHARLINPGTRWRWRHVSSPDRAPMHGGS